MANMSRSIAEKENAENKLHFILVIEAKDFFLFFLLIFLPLTLFLANLAELSRIKKS